MNRVLKSNFNFFKLIYIVIQILYRKILGNQQKRVYGYCNLVKNWVILKKNRHLFYFELQVSVLINRHFQKFISHFF